MAALVCFHHNTDACVVGVSMPTLPEAGVVPWSADVTGCDCSGVWIAGGAEVVEPGVSTAVSELAEDVRLSSTLCRNDDFFGMAVLPVAAAAASVGVACSSSALSVASNSEVAAVSTPEESGVTDGAGEGRGVRRGLESQPRAVNSRPNSHRNVMDRHVHDPGATKAGLASIHTVTAQLDATTIVLTRPLKELGTITWIMT